MTVYKHEFETTVGDELLPAELGAATYKVVDTFVDYDPDEDTLVFTHRIELWMTYDAVLQGWNRKQ